MNYITKPIVIGSLVAIITHVVAEVWRRSRRKNITPSYLLRKDFRRGKRYQIRHVRIPISNLSPPDDFVDLVDEEGLVLCHVTVEASGIVCEIQPARKDTKKPEGDTAIYDAKGSILMSCFVDAHTHLIKTQNVPRLRNVTGTWSEALRIEAYDQAKHWSNPQDIERRMEFAICCALHHGTMALRTHLDGCEGEAAENVYRVYSRLVEKYAKQDFILQGVANLYLPLWLEEPLATRHADHAARHANVVLGAYCDNPSQKEGGHDLSVRSMKALLSHARRLNLDVDLHIDESNDPASRALDCLIEALQEARQLGYSGRVVLGHCSSLSLQAPEKQAEVCTALAELGAFVVANPTTNLGLQDRRGSILPQSRPIAADIPRTPQWRGLTLVQELAAAGVTVCMASDNVRDHWHPYGDYDLLHTWSLGLQVAHLDTAPSAGAWAHLVASSPARAMGLQTNNLLQIGQALNGVLFPRARRVSELLARPQTCRIVLRQGVAVERRLPSFEELDDLVAESSRTS